MHFLGSIGEKHLYTLFDSGSDYSCIHPDYLDGLESPIKLNRSRRLATANENDYLEIKEWVCLQFLINDELLSDEFLVVPDLSEEVIIGAATLQKWRIKLDFEQEKVIVKPKDKWRI